MIKFWKRRPKVVTHVHDLAELPTDMGRKIYRVCRTKGCSFSETIPAPDLRRIALAPVAARIESIQRGILDEVTEELEGRS